MEEEEIAAFQQLKAALVNAPVLGIFDPKLPTEIHTDASMYGYGAVMLQKNSEDQQYHPVEYMSRKTNEVEQKYHSYELEVLAIIEALKKWRIYLMGIRIKIVTDCNAFTMTMKKKDVPLRVARWAMFLQQFDYQIEHRSGVKMKHVDALSRVFCLMVEDSLQHRIREAQTQDEFIKCIRTLLETDNKYLDFYVKHGILYKDPIKELIVIPSSMEQEIIKIAHRQGHYAVQKTKDLVERLYHIPNLTPKVHNIVKSCIECLVAEAKSGKKEGMLNPINKDDKPFNTYHIDHLGPMEQTKKRYNHIFVVIDGFSKFVWLYSTRSTGAEEVVDRLKKQSSVFGNPSRIISDRGTAFTSNAFKTYCEEENIQHLLIATGMPRGNGQVERINRIIIPMLTKLCVEDSKSWYKHVEHVRSTMFSPFRILTGVEMRLKANTSINQLLEDTILEELDPERSQIREEARQHILKIQEENRKTFNKSRKPETEYNINDLVAVKRTQYGPGLKLKPKFFGPYKVTQKKRHGRYTVEKVGDVKDRQNVILQPSI